MQSTLQGTTKVIFSNQTPPGEAQHVVWVPPSMAEIIRQNNVLKRSIKDLVAVGKENHRLKADIQRIKNEKIAVWITESQGRVQDKEIIAILRKKLAQAEAESARRNDDLMHLYKETQYLTGELVATRMRVQTLEKAQQEYDQKAFEEKKHADFLAKMHSLSCDTGASETSDPNTETPAAELLQRQDRRKTRRPVLFDERESATSSSPVSFKSSRSSPSVLPPIRN